jgi:hypothetical protein
MALRVLRTTEPVPFFLGPASLFDDDPPRHGGVRFAEVVVGPGRLELERILAICLQGLGVEEWRCGCAGYGMGDVVAINPGDAGARRDDEFLGVKNKVIDGHFRRRAGRWRTLQGIGPRRRRAGCGPPQGYAPDCQADHGHHSNEVEPQKTEPLHCLNLHAPIAQQP